MREHPGGSEFLMTIFEEGESVIAVYDRINNKVSSEVYEIQAQHKEKEYKENFYYDEAYVLTIKFRVVKTDREIDLVSR